ncbi:MAG: C40 family peptidase [Rhodobacteraceae bacterium]|nr:C40 family peptidase [Paracoccaceae bacterium]
MSDPEAPSPPLDPRRAAFRADLADARLRGRVASERFAEGHLAVIATPCAPVLKAPPLLGAPGARTATLLRGEVVRVFDQDAEGWAWAQAGRDGYVGYLKADCLAALGAPATHAAAFPWTPLYAEPGFRAATQTGAPMGALLTVDPSGAMEGGFMSLIGGLWAYQSHLRALDNPAMDWVSAAERFEGAPYLWGGETLQGIDCSGLIQTALEAGGRACPRDSDMQMAELGEPIDVDGPLRRGDIIGWRGHIGVMLDETVLLHATGAFMACVRESLEAARRRIEAQGDGPATGARRLGVFPPNLVAETAAFC